MFGRKKDSKIKVTDNGPYVVSGEVPLKKQTINSNDQGEALDWKEGKVYKKRGEYLLCRCGSSSDKPFCDGSHIAKKFDGKETAGNTPFKEQSETTKGPEIDLDDAVKYCASARFCNRAGGTWKLTEESDDPEKKEIALQESFNCPSGRLVHTKKDSGEPIEPELEQSIGVTEDPKVGVSGPFWVRGKIPLESAEGVEYEKRNRMTLCRCGNSKNKPFCDGSHVSSKFDDGEILNN